MLLGAGGLLLTYGIVLLLMLIGLLNLTLLLYMCRCLGRRCAKIEWPVSAGAFVAIAKLEMLFGGVVLVIIAGVLFYYAVYRLVGGVSTA
ncbi:MAG: hypothetical protein Q4B48_07255 [Syntrophomonadaceae bacterium]|nr:hypothetical protein [Syntrophomonadaceae bacterium]